MEGIPNGRDPKSLLFSLLFLKQELGFSWRSRVRMSSCRVEQATVGCPILVWVFILGRLLVFICPPSGPRWGNQGWKEKSEKSL